MHGIDISANQVHHAVQSHNIDYCVCRAERTPFADNSFDLITVAQAYHWIDAPRFCDEATRIARPRGIVAIWVYDLAYSMSPIDAIVRHWNFEILSPYWEPERKHVYTHYESLAFEFESIASPKFEIEVSWNCEELVGHLKTWSALQTMKRKVGDRAFQETVQQIQAAWGVEDKRRFVFPVFLKLGRVKK